MSIQECAMVSCRPWMTCSCCFGPGSGGADSTSMQHPLTLHCLGQHRNQTHGLNDDMKGTCQSVIHTAVYGGLHLGGTCCYCFTEQSNTGAPSGAAST